MNLVTLDMLRANQVHAKLDYTKGFATYSYPQVQEARVHDNIREHFVAAVSDHVIADQWAPAPDINAFVFLALLGKQRVLLLDMPELLLRQVLGNSISLAEAKDIFQFVLAHRSPGSSMAATTRQLFGHVFQQPRDLYIAALLKRVLQAASSVLAVVANPHFVPVQHYWQPPPGGVNFTQATKVPPRIPGETPEMLVEKQALFEVLLDSRLWGEKYVVNVFPYLAADPTSIS